MKRVSLIAALCFLLLPVVGLADVVSFSGGSGGTITSNGTTLTDTGIPISLVGTTTSSGGAVVVGYLNFTGTLGPGSGTLGGTSIFNFDDLTFTINGTVPAAQTGPPWDPYYTNPTPFLPPGNVNLASLVTQGTGYATLVTKGPNTWTVGIYGNAWLYDGLAEYLGEPDDEMYALNGSLNINPLATNCVGANYATCAASGFTLSPGGSTLTLNSNGVVPPPPTGVPEPATLSLLGFGLFGVLGLARRRS